MTGKRPNYNGKVQFEDGEHREDVGKIALWDNTEPTSDKSPLFTGTVTIKNVIYRVSLWKNTPMENK